MEATCALHHGVTRILRRSASEGQPAWPKNGTRRGVGSQEQKDDSWRGRRGRFCISEYGLGRMVDFSVKNGTRHIGGKQGRLNFFMIKDQKEKKRLRDGLVFRLFFDTLPCYGIGEQYFSSQFWGQVRSFSIYFFLYFFFLRDRPLADYGPRLESVITQGIVFVHCC